MHKWWHGLFITMIGVRTRHETSYCGNILFSHYMCVTYKCHICKQFKVEITDYKDSKDIEIGFDKFEEINKKRIELNYPH